MVDIENISYSYNNSKNILNNICFSIEPGQCIAIMGNNGVGKSTLLKCIDRIYPTHGAVVMVEGQNVFNMNSRDMAKSIAYVPQNIALSNMTVFDAVLLGRRPYIKWDVTKEDREIVSNIINQLGLDKFQLRNISELSGGEAQRVMLARALAQQPSLLLLDEPTSNLDPYNQQEVLNIVKKVAKEQGICVIIIIHDLNLAIRYCDKFLFLKDSEIYSYGGHDTVNQKTIFDVYGIHTEIIEHRGIKIIVPE